MNLDGVDEQERQMHLTELLTVCKRQHDHCLAQAQIFPIWAPMHSEYLAAAAQWAKFHSHAVTESRTFPAELHVTNDD